MSGNPICVVCNTENPPGATHCRKCRSPLRLFDTMQLSDQSPLSAREINPYQGKLPPRTVALRFLGKREPLLVRVDDEIILGRAMPKSSNYLVDLSAHRAGLLGVSRQHAIITRQGRKYAIEDLRSTNGTWVNAQRLVPGQPHTLQSGDQVQLGELILFISFAPRIAPAAAAV
jgi:hypothetical protein